jgi:hypothetical protein
MSVETYKVINKKVVKENVDPFNLDGQLKAGWALSAEDAKKNYKKDLKEAKE